MPMNNRIMVPRQRGWSFQDSDARAYAMAVYAADGATLEPLVGKAIDDLVIGLKADGVWTSIGAACLLSGPRTLAGALVPLRGPAPTNTGFSAADYSRTRGLAGDGSGKRLSSNYNNNTPSQNDFSMSVWKTSTLLNDSALIGAGAVVGGASFFGAIGPTGNGYYLNRYVGPVVSALANVAEDLGFCGMNRSTGTEFVYRRNGTNTTVARNSATPLNATIDVFATSSLPTPANVRLAWYHAGSSLDMAALEARLSTYLAAVNAAIAGAPIVSNVDAQGWINRVYYNGGTVSSSTASAVNTFCNSIDSEGIRDRFYRMNLYAGDGLLSALVPLYRGPVAGGAVFGNATDGNNGPFVAADFTETGSGGGLFGNASTKYLNTGAVLATLNAASVHCGVYGRSFSPDSAPSKALIGGSGVSFANIVAITLRDGGGTASLGFGCDVTNRASSSVPSGGHFISSAVSSTDLRLILNGVQTGGTMTTNRGTTAAYSGNIFVHGANSNGSLSTPAASGLQAYHLGLGLSVAQAASLYTAMLTFQTALGRQ